MKLLLITLIVLFSTSAFSLQDPSLYPCNIDDKGPIKFKFQDGQQHACRDIFYTQEICV